ncbi:MAG: NYN domain-containing protein [Eggerthellaceae bacterium]|nr:NYN domain-containing protein [Eggerthellaceae bacterium]
MANRRKKLLIVDGYNVLRSGSRYTHLRDNPDYTDDRLNKSREALLNDTIAYMGRDYEEAIIVYDGGDNSLSAGSDERIGDVRVIFTSAGVTADQRIEKLAYDARERGWEVVVVSSDAGVQDTVFGGGVDRMSSNGFSRESELLDEETRLDESPKVAVKHKVAERIDPAVADKLRTLRDSL